MMKLEVEGKQINWLSEADYQKAISQFRMQLYSVMKPLEKHGQQVYVTGAINAIVKLTEDFGLRVRGVDHPIDLEIIKGQIQVRDE